MSRHCIQPKQPIWSVPTHFSSRMHFLSSKITRVHCSSSDFVFQLCFATRIWIREYMQECVCLTLLFAVYACTHTHTHNKQLLKAQQRHTKSLLEVTYAASMLMSSSVEESCTSVCVCWYECVSVFAPQRHDKQTQTEGRKPPSGRVRCAVLFRFCEYLPIAPYGANTPCHLLLCSFVLVHLLIFMLPLNINARSQYYDSNSNQIQLYLIK